MDDTENRSSENIERTNTQDAPVREFEDQVKPEQTQESYQSQQVFTSASNQTNGLTNDERTMGMLAHLLALFTSFWGPLIIWLVKKDESEFVNFHGKESLNFQISLFIYWTITGVASAVGVGFLIMPVLGIFSLVVMIQATIAANNGDYYQYPLCIRFLS